MATRLDDGADLAVVIRRISDTIDGTYKIDPTSEAALWRRCMKTAEEVGEVTEALLGVVGENPRKGQSHQMLDLRHELLDVALAALGAVAHIDSHDPVELLDRHARDIYLRLLNAVNPL